MFAIRTPARALSGFALVLALAAASGCGPEDDDECSDANDVALRILEEAEQSGIPPNALCVEADLREKHEELCAEHARLLAECED